MSGFARRLQQGVGITAVPTAPFPPAEPSITAGNASVTVFWSAPTSNGGSPITGYTVTVNPGAHTATVGAATFSATVGGLTNGTSYSATVTATNAIGSATSASSNSVTPSASTPAFPDATTTGVPAGTTLTASGSISVQSNNTTLDSLDISGEIKVYPGVTGTIIKNCRITTSGGTYCIDCKYSGSAGPVTIQDCQIISTPTTNTASCVNLSAGSTIIRCDISGSKQSVVGSMTGTTIQDNYMHDLVNVSGSAHCENIYMSASGGSTMIVHNTLQNPLTQTANIFLDSKNGTITGVTMQNNLLAGGGYCIYGGGGTTPATAIQILNNQYSRLIGTAPGTQPYTAYFANGGQFGPKTSIVSDAQSAYSGNVWADNGSPA